MVLSYIKKITHSMLCVTDVYLRDKTNTVLSILHLTVGHLSVFCSFCFVFADKVFCWGKGILCCLSLLVYFHSDEKLWESMA